MIQAKGNEIRNEKGVHLYKRVENVLEGSGWTVQNIPI